MKKPIYLDYNATTPVDERVFKAMQPYFCEQYGNASSTSHAFGWDADMAVRKARKQVAELIGATSPKEIYFTSGATESNNLAIKGISRRFFRLKEKVHLITTAVEHKAVLDVLHDAEKDGAEITILPVSPMGQVSVDQVANALKPYTRLVSIIFGNNEIGSINPIREIGALCRSKGVIFHTDAAQAVGKVDFKVNDFNIDLLSASGQKMYAPKGIGFLYVREALFDHLVPLMAGGSQERGLRPGTLNVPGIVGLGEACAIFSKEMVQEIPRLCELRDYLVKKALEISPQIELNGHPSERLCTNVSLTLNGLNSDLFALGLGGLAVSSASACSAGAPSYVLKAIGRTDAQARATLRIGLGRPTTKEHIDAVLTALAKYY